MSDEGPVDDGGSDDALPPPYRPWGASGVAQPGADRPASRRPSANGPASSIPTSSAATGGPEVRGLGGRRGRVAPPPVPPEHPPASAPPAGPRWYAPVAAAHPATRPVPGTVLPAARPVTPYGSRTGADRVIVASVLALIAMATSWMPWFKSPTAGVFTVSDSTFVRVLNAWDVPVRFLWSYHSPRGGPSLGWFVLGGALGILALGFVADARTAVRVLAAVEALMAILFLVQVARIIQASPTVGAIDIGVTDLAGLGAYVLLVVSLVLLIVPRD